MSGGRRSCASCNRSALTWASCMLRLRSPASQSSRSWRLVWSVCCRRLRHWPNSRRFPPNNSCQREWSSPRPAARQGNCCASTWPNSVCDWSMSLRRISRSAALGLVRQGIGVFVTDPLILMSGLSSDVVVRRLVPELRVTLTMIYHRQRPVPRLAVRFMANLHDTLASMCASQAPSVCEAKAI